MQELAELAVPGSTDVGSSPRTEFRGLWQAACRLASPRATLALFRELDARDRVLSRLGWALMITVPVFTVLAIGLPGAGAVNPWMKPIRVSLSFSTFVTTISIFLLVLRIPEWQLRAARWVVVAGSLIELAGQSGQAWRIANAYHAGVLDVRLQQMSTAMFAVNTAVMLWIFALICMRRVNAAIDAPMRAAILYGIGIFLGGNAVGGFMLARGSHTIGALDGGSGIPFLNWSWIHGDLRVAHFIALHAIQIVPIFAYVLAQMAPCPALRRRNLAVAGLAMVVALVVGLTFGQAMMGRPLFAGF